MVWGKFGYMLMRKLTSRSFNGEEGVKFWIVSFWRGCPRTVCGLFSRSVHNSHMFLDFDQRKRSALGSNLRRSVPNSHSLLTEALTHENQCSLENIQRMKYYSALLVFRLHQCCEAQLRLSVYLSSSSVYLKSLPWHHMSPFYSDFPYLRGS